MQKSAVLSFALFAALIYVATTNEGGHTDCKTRQTYEGDTATMTFSISPEMILSTDPFFAYVIRENDTTNILQCERRKPLSDISCEILPSHVQTKGIVNGSLTLYFPHVTQAMRGQYRLHVHFNATWDILRCNLTVQGLNSTGRSDKGSNTTTVVAVVVSLVIVSAIVGITVFCCCQPNLRKSVQSATPLLPSDDTNIPPWVFMNMSTKEAKDRLLSKDKEDFTFLVRLTDKKMFISVKLAPDRVNNFGIHHNVKGYWIEPQHGFLGLSNLVDHYKKFEGVWGHTLGKIIDANTSAT